MSLFEAMLSVVAQKAGVSEVKFPKSLIGTTMQDGGKRERRAVEPPGLNKHLSI